MAKWNFDSKDHHQTTVRIDRATADMLDTAFDNLTNRTIQKLVIDALRHYCSCSKTSAFSTRLEILEQRVTAIEAE